MASKVPQKMDFETAEKCKTLNDICRYIILGISLFQIMLGFLNFECNLFKNVMVVVLFVMTVFHMIVEKGYAHHFRSAEETRRKGFFDKSFGTKMADIDSEGYYDTDDVPHGLRKALANLHENSFYSNRISGEMLSKVQKKLVFMGLLFIVITVTNVFKVQVTVALINAIMALDVIGEFLGLKYFYTETKRVFEECKGIWEDFDNDRSQADNKLFASIMKAYSRYETTLAYESIMLDSKIYNKLNAQLENEWEGLKKRYNMTGKSSQ